MIRQVLLPSLRPAGRLHHIGISRTLARTGVLLLVDDLNLPSIAATGELLRPLTLNPARDYRPPGTPPGRPPRQTTNTPTK